MSFDRRTFLQMSALGAAGLSLGVPAEGIQARSIQAEARPARRYVPPSDRLTVGMIAVGARAHQLIEHMQALGDVEIVAVCDAYRGRIERAIQRTGGRARAYRDYRELLQQADVDAVVVSSPDHLHARHAIDSLEAGKPIYIEKPLAYSIEEGRRIVEVANRTGLPVQVGSSGISGPIAQKAREIVASGKLGQVTLIRAYYNRNTASGAWIYPIPPDASPETVDWDQFLGSAPERPYSNERFFRWRCYRDYSGGMSTDLFVHLCTTIHYVMDAPMCEKAVAMGGLYRWTESRDVPDTINASLAYPEGFMVSLSGTFNNQGGGGSGIEILGTEGTLTIGSELTFRPEHVDESNFWIIDSWPQALEEAYYADPANRAAEMPWTRPPRVLPGAETYTEEGTNDTELHFREFFDAVRNGTPTREDALVGHHAAACAHLVNQALDSGETAVWENGE